MTTKPKRIVIVELPRLACLVREYRQSNRWLHRAFDLGLDFILGEIFAFAGQIDNFDAGVLVDVISNEDHVPEAEQEALMDQIDTFARAVDELTYRECFAWMHATEGVYSEFMSWDAETGVAQFLVEKYS